MAWFAFGSIGAVLFAFHLYLLVHWDRVKRTKFFLIGLAGLAAMLVGNLFLCLGMSGGVMAGLAALFYSLGLLAALAGAVGACYPERLPWFEDEESGTPASPKDVPLTET